MKGILCAMLLVSLQSPSPARAYEADIHYSTTYVLARAAGWPEADALTIASANQGVDENQDTVAALELDTTPGGTLAGYVTSSFRQAEKNLKFHCFSKTRGQPGKISADVVEVISGHFAAVPAHNSEPRRKARRLIALGVALHCQQDAYSHAGFGGSCGPYPGSCYGHSHRTFLDRVAFHLVGKHFYDPDHPGVSGQSLQETLESTASILAAHRPRASLRSIPARQVAALSNALRGSGLELDDELRRECNRHIAGKWLFDFFGSVRRTQDHAGLLETLTPEIARNCKNASLASATVARIPKARFPRLRPDASPSLVRADGTYGLLRDGEFAVSVPAIHAAGMPAAARPNYHAHRTRVQLSHWSQILALPIMGRVALSPAENNRKAR